MKDIKLTKKEHDSLGIYETNNYNRFNFIHVNRNISRDHVNHLKKAIMANNMLHAKPIVVDQQYNIIDGQHRFIAARELNLKIYYAIVDGFEEDIISLNANQRSWQTIDYVQYYAKKGIDSYKRALDLINRYGAGVANTIEIISKNHSGGDRRKLRSGNYEAVSTVEAERRVKTLSSLKDLFKNRLYISQVRALKRCFDIIEFDEVHFLNRCKTCRSKFINEPELKEQLRVFENIYNYRLQEKNHIRLF